jgi:hypothetical protein
MPWHRQGWVFRRDPNWALSSLQPAYKTSNCETVLLEDTQGRKTYPNETP